MLPAGPGPTLCTAPAPSNPTQPIPTSPSSPQPHNSPVRARGPGGGKSRAHLSVGLSPIFPGTLFFCFIFSRIHHMKKFKLLPRLKQEQKQRPAGGEGGTAAPFLRPRSRRGARHKGNGAAKPSQNNPTCPSSRCSPAASFSPDPKTQNREVVAGGNGPWSLRKPRSRPLETPRGAACRAGSCRATFAPSSSSQMGLSPILGPSSTAQTPPPRDQQPPVWP